MGTLNKKWGPNGDPKSEKGPHGDPGPQMGTHVGAVELPGKYDSAQIMKFKSHLSPGSVAPQLASNSDPILDAMLPDKLQQAIVLLRSPSSKLAPQE